LAKPTNQNLDLCFINDAIGYRCLYSVLISVGLACCYRASMY